MIYMNLKKYLFCCRDRQITILILLACIIIETRLLQHDHYVSKHLLPLPEREMHTEKDISKRAQKPTGPDSPLYHWLLATSQQIVSWKENKHRQRIHRPPSVNKVIADLVIGLDPSILFELFCACPTIYTNIQHSVDIMCLLNLCLYVALMKQVRCPFEVCAKPYPALFETVPKSFFGHFCISSPFYAITYLLQLLSYFQD